MNQVKQGISYEDNLEAWDIADEAIRKASARPSLILGAAGAMVGFLSTGWSSGSAMGEALYPGKS